jgi:diaminopimelate epimerase
MAVPFHFMDGAANYMIVLNCLNSEYLSTHYNHIRWNSLAHEYLTEYQRDQMLIILRGTKAPYFMRLFNRDGSEGSNCGNGIRCVAKLLKDFNFVNVNEKFKVETLRSVAEVEIVNDDEGGFKYKVNMGCPNLLGKKVFNVKNKDGTERNLDGWMVDVGVAHCVVVMNSSSDINDELVQFIGPQIETHEKTLEVFPDRTNVNFVSVMDQKNVKMRVWERGVGETKACGSGACASGFLLISEKLVDEDMKIHLLGGILDISVKDGNVYKTGPAQTNFVKEFDLERYFATCMRKF